MSRESDLYFNRPTETKTLQLLKMHRMEDADHSNRRVMEVLADAHPDVAAVRQQAVTMVADRIDTYLRVCRFRQRIIDRGVALPPLIR